MEDSENTDPWRLYGVKNCYNIFWGDTRPIIRPRLRTHFADIQNSQLMYTVKLLYERWPYPVTLISKSMVSLADSPFKFPLLSPSRFLDPLVLAIFSPKNVFRASMELEPMVPALALRCFTKWALKTHMLEADQFIAFIFTRDRNEWMRREMKSIIWSAGIQMKLWCDHRSCNRNLSHCKF